MHAPGTVVELISATLLAERVAVPSASASSRAAPVPPELDAICARAAAPRREDRYASARELADAIERFLDGERDIERRRELASAHARAARESVDVRTSGEAGRAARARALQEAGRALALDPDHAEALAVITELVAHEPETFPPEVAAEIDAQSVAQQRAGLAGRARSHMFHFVTVALAALGGVRGVPLAACVGLVMVSLLIAFAYRNQRLTPARSFALIASTTFAIGSMSVLFGPFVLVPAFAAVHTVLTVTYGREYGTRPGVVAGGALMLLLPWALEAMGLLPPSFAITVAGRIELLPRAVAFRPTVTPLALLVTNLLAIVVPGTLALRVRGALDKAERRAMLQRWQLQEMLPAVARGLSNART
jgi:serine/threonine-protein kinase